MRSRPINVIRYEPDQISVLHFGRKYIRGLFIAGGREALMIFKVSDDAARSSDVGYFAFLFMWYRITVRTLVVAGDRDRDGDRDRKRIDRDKGREN
jgi:hypothetical protein